MLNHTSVAQSALAWFAIDLEAGNQALALNFAQWRAPDADEARPLAIMLRNLDLIAPVTALRPGVIL